jgi:pimeloyl-ACP methyl ester carboxylesterase
MQVDVNGTRLWFDVDGPVLVPNGPSLRRRPTLILVHGGPASYDHSYFKPHFAPLTEHMQVIYLDLRDHGRSARHAPATWSFEVCADDLRAFCDAVGIARPVILGHSMGGFVAMLFGARHPGRAAGLILQSTMARFDLDRLVDGFRDAAGDEVAELARRSYSGDPVADEDWARIFAAVGPRVPSEEELGRRIRNVELGAPAGQLLHRFDVVAQLARISCPTLISVGQVDPVTPVAASREILTALPPELGRLEVIDGAGHFPWLDRPERCWSLITEFVAAATAGPGPATDSR